MPVPAIDDVPLLAVATLPECVTLRPNMGTNQTPFRTQLGREVSFHLPEDALCPCKSGRLALACCVTNEGFRKRKTLATSPPGPKTGKRHRRCYASCLNDCGLKISREHALSKNILDKLHAEDCLHVAGQHWQDDGCHEPTSPKALASRVLCDRHNSALSPLDTEGGRIFDAFKDWDAPAGSLNSLYIFNGHDIERWLLKVLCGMAATGPLFDRETDQTIANSWVETLFGVNEFGSEVGLYACKEPGIRLHGVFGLSCRPLARQGKLSGLAMSIGAYELVLSLAPLSNRLFEDRSVAFRPCEFHIVRDKSEKSILLCWDGPADGGTIHFQPVQTSDA